MLPRLYTLLASLAPFAAAALPATNSTAIVPRVMIVSMFEPESQIWFDRFNTSGLGDIANTSVPVVGMSMLFPHVYCTASREICQVTVGEGEINAAASTIALILSSKFDLRSTYWLLGGIGGVNPERATLGSVGFARYAVQVALQYEIDGRDVPEDWVTGYIPYGQKDPRGYPTITYGTEVFELNANLRDLAVKYASQATLEDQSGPQAYRAKYKDVPSFKTGAQPPAIVKCDIATSDVYYTGHRLAQAFDQTIDIWTNGTGEYCMSAQEDNAVLEGLVRGAVEGLVDFSRVIVYRVGSNFDRPPPGRTDYQHLTEQDQNGFEISVRNTYNAGIEIVRGIVKGWNCTFAKGVAPDNYIGDIFGSLGGQPDYGLGSITQGKKAKPAQFATRLHQRNRVARK